MTQTQIDALMNLWNSMFPDYCPPQTQFALWLELNGAEITRKGIISASKKFMRLGCNMSAEYLTKYASSCMKNAKLKASG
jgi:hypothetical protein